MRAYLSFLIVVVLAGSLSSCAWYKRDRCYLEETRYMSIRAIFEETGSYQRAAQAMKDEGWAHCEVNQFRYRLRKDLLLNDAEMIPIYSSEEPARGTLDFNPGRVEHIAKDKPSRK